MTVEPKVEVGANSSSDDFSVLRIQPIEGMMYQANSHLGFANRQVGRVELPLRSHPDFSIVFVTCTRPGRVESTDSDTNATHDEHSRVAGSPLIV
jgi:hypothetical protein